MAELGAEHARLAFEVGEDGDGSPLVTLSGELDISNAGRVEAAVIPVIARSPKRLVVDVSGLEFADSSAIALLVRWANVVPQVELREPPDLLSRVITRM